MQTKQKTWTFKKKTQAFLISNELKNNGRIIKGAILAVLVGFIVAGIIVAVQNVNPFEYYGHLFRIAFHPLYLSQTMQWLSVYIVAGLAMAVGFKTGLFNIGVSGQMLAGAAMGTVIFNLVTPGAARVEGWMIFVIFLVCVAMGTLLAGIAGWLKAMFNIHEVVTTIMLNWIMWYLFKFVFFKWKSIFVPNEGVATAPFPQGALNWGTSEIAGPLIIAAVAVIIVWIIFSKTVFGFRLKAVGSSPSVSKYAGINVRNKIIASMAISGALAGLASFLNIFTVSPNLTFGIDNLPTVGYDAIAVALVAFNNPFGIVGVSLLWGTVQSAGSSAAGLFNMPSQMSLLIFGIVVYFAAISIVFIKWAPGYSLKLRYYIWNSKLYSNKTKELNRKVLQYRWWLHEPSRNRDYAEQMAKFKQKIKSAQNETEIKEIKTEIKNYKFDFKENCRLNLSKYETQLKNYKTNVYIKEIERGLAGIKTRSHQRINSVNEQGLDQVNLLNLELVKTKAQLTNLMNGIVKAKKHQIKVLKSQFLKDKNALKVWREGELGETKLDFELNNKKVAFKGEYSKQKNALEEEIKNARSEQRLQFHLLKFNDQMEKSEKQTERQKVQKATKIKILKLKLEISTQKQILKQNLAELKFKHAWRVIELKENPLLLEAIEKEYQSRLAQLKTQYDQDLALVEEKELTRINQFELAKPGDEFDQGQSIFNQCLAKISETKVDSQTSLEKQIEILTQQLEIIKTFGRQINQLWGENHFKPTDTDEAVKKKVEILVEMAKLEHLYGVQLVICTTNQVLVKTKLQNQNILTNYKTSLTNFKQEYKNNLKVIKEQPKVENYSQLLIENEEIYFNKINEHISELEEKYIVKAVN